MNLLITGADRSLGRLAAGVFRNGHRLRLTGTGPSLAGELSDLEYRPADLRTPEEVAPLVEGMDAVLHLAVFDPAPLSGAAAEQERLDVAARGTYVLLSEARKAGVERAILVSTLALFEAYPEDYVVDETWQPQPPVDAEALAPYLSELTCREFARAGELYVACLRFGPLGEAEGTTEEDAVRALESALALEIKLPGYRWGLFHISSGKRFSTGAERGPLQLERRVD